MSQSSSKAQGQGRATRLPPIDHGYAWVIVGVAAVVFMLAVGVFRSQTVYLEPAISRFNQTKATMTLMSTGVFVVSQLLTLPGNVMSEWLGPRVNVAVAGVCGIACFVICAFAPVFPLYFASYVLFQGAAFALCYSPVVVTVNRYFHVYRPLASSIALGGVSVGSMIIPNVLKWLIKLTGGGNEGMKWSMLLAGLFVAVTIPIAIIFLRPITLEQLQMVEAERKKAAAASAASPAAAVVDYKDKEQEQMIELGTLTKGEPEPRKETDADPDAITSEPEPKVVTSDDTNGAADGEKKKEKEGAGTNDLEAREQLLMPAPGQPEAPPAVEVTGKKKSSDIAAAFAYFKHFPSLFQHPTYLIHALHFAVIMTVDNIFTSITFDSFYKELTISEEFTTTTRIVCATANLVGRFASGLFLVMPVLIAKCSKQPAGANANGASGSCFDTVKKYLTVRIIYCGASVFFVLSVLLVGIVGLPGGATTSWPLMFIYILLGLSGGTLFSQFPVVLAELVGLPRLAAGHALFMLIQVPVTGLKFFSGTVAEETKKWAVAYLILFVICIIVTIINSASLLLGDRIRRLLCRKSAQPASANAPAHA